MLNGYFSPDSLSGDIYELSDQGQRGSLLRFRAGFPDTDQSAGTGTNVDRGHGTGQ
jgi:hypothetical protein